MRFTVLVVSAAVFAVSLCSPVRPLAAGVMEWPASVHTQLEASVPADGDTLTQSPPHIRLEFNRAVDASLGELRLVAADGTGLALRTEGDPADDRVLLATPPALDSGSYRVVWRIVADDGHPVTGEFAFVVDLPPAPAGSAADSVAAAAARADSAGVGRDAAAAAEWQAAGTEEASAEPSRGVVGTLRALGVGALLALAGVLGFVAWWAPVPVPGAQRLGVVLVVLTPIFLLAHSVAWLGYIAPPDGGMDLGFAGAALNTVTGRLELVRFVAALLAAFALLRLRRVGLAAALALLAVLLSGGTGHAADGPFLVAATKSAHLLAAAVWIGGLLLLVTSRPEPTSFPTLASRVSGLALTSVIVIAVSGAWQTIDLLPSFGDLFGSGYGRMVLAKLGGLGVLMGFGAVHRVRIMPRLAGTGGADEEQEETGSEMGSVVTDEDHALGDQESAIGDRESAARDLRRSVAREFVVLVVVLLLAGFLAYLPLPEIAAGAASLP
jgi:copper transport protein